MFTCPEDDIHSIYADGELPQNYISEYEAHVRSCPKCSARLKTFQALHSVFSGDKDALHFSQENLDSSFERLQARLSYKKITHSGKNNFMIFQAMSGIKYFAAGIAAAAVFVFILPGSRGSNPFERQIPSFQPVARTSISSTANQVTFDGNIDVSVLNSILASDSADQSFSLQAVSYGQDSDAPVLIIAGPHLKRKTQTPSLTSYDVFYPQEQESMQKDRNKGFSFYVSYPFSENLASGN
ncbi:anti-sigma factor family protein [Treponema sp.]|uniref:anti-sigma factor family protein n=1 Tax=Treponema sp. TaxID=166 RepID=UPI003F062E76